MAIKTFTTGEILTASDTNTYLANSGLVYIKQQTIGNAVTSVLVSDAFSATYDNYKIIISSGTSSTQDRMWMRMGANTSAYYGMFIYGAISIASVFGANSNNTTDATYIGGCDINALYLNVELVNPFLAKHTGMHGSLAIWGNNRGTATYDHEVASSFTSFTIGTGSGSMTGGTIYVYGYRKA